VRLNEYAHVSRGWREESREKEERRLEELESVNVVKVIVEFGRRLPQKIT
jgi:hypothetical protein